MLAQPRLHAIAIAMTEVVWVALISAGGAVIAALATQILIARAAGQAASRAVEKEARDWQRSESRRREELHDERLREFWARVLLSQTRVINGLIELTNNRPPMPKFEVSGASAAGEAYSIALLGLVRIRPHARDFYNATATVQRLMEDCANSRVPENTKRLDSVMDSWRASFNALEAVIQQEYLVHTSASGEARATSAPAA